MNPIASYAFIAGGVLVGIVLSTMVIVDARAVIKTIADHPEQVEVATQSAEGWATRSATVLQLAGFAFCIEMALMLVFTPDGWRGAWSPVAFAVFVVAMRKAIHWQQRKYAELLFGVDLRSSEDD